MEKIERVCIACKHYDLDHPFYNTSQGAKDICMKCSGDHKQTEREDGTGIIDKTRTFFNPMFDPKETPVTE